MRNQDAAANLAARDHLVVVLDAELEHLDEVSRSRQHDLKRDKAVALVRDGFARILRDGVANADPTEAPRRA
jgi:hypothetical protein